MSRRPKKKHDGRRFAGIPHEVLDSPGYLTLSAHAKALLLDLVRQFSGYDNGNQQVTWTAMKARGWRSKETLNLARLELLKHGLIAQTRQGHRPHRASLYGLLWHNLDECRDKRGAYKLDIESAEFNKLRGAYDKFDGDRRNFRPPPAVPQTPASRAIRPSSAIPDPRQPGQSDKKGRFQTPASRTPLYITKGGMVPGTVVGDGGAVPPSARIVTAMLAAGWLCGEPLTYEPVGIEI